jgi:hypothetical protein
MEVTDLTLEQRVICFKAAAVGLIDDDDDLEHELTQLNGYTMHMLAGFVDRIAQMVTEKMTDDELHADRRHYNQRGRDFIEQTLASNLLPTIHLRRN